MLQSCIYFLSPPAAMLSHLLCRLCSALFLQRREITLVASVKRVVRSATPCPVHKDRLRTRRHEVQQPPKNYVLFTNLTHLYLPIQSSDHWCQIPCFCVLIALGSTIMHLNLQDMSMSYAQLLLSQVRCSAQTVLTVASLYT